MSSIASRLQTGLYSITERLANKGALSGTPIRNSSRLSTPILSSTVAITSLRYYENCLSLILRLVHFPPNRDES